MALNWTLLSEDGQRPVPLPGEKVFFSAEKCTLSLDYRSHARKWMADGTAFVTSQRIIFVRLPPLPAPADPTVASAHLRTLSVPLAQFVDTRYLIPVFSAAYYEATVISSHDGGLPAGGASGLLKLWFNQGGGMAFRDAVEESKSRREEGAAHFESLPVYEPRQGATSTPREDIQQTSHAPSDQPDRPPHRRPIRSDSLPDPDDMAAAGVAQEEEERERDEERLRAQGAPLQSHEQEEEPPAYQA